MNRRVRTRFAPSPTGPLHIGGVRTALYSYLFAKKHGGDFILRIEDTDRQRYVPGAEEYIVESLTWCGIVPDESSHHGGPCKPYRQSERISIYHRYAEKLLAEGHAYYAFDTASELEALRLNAEKEKRIFSYDASVRLKLKNSLSLSSSDTEKLLRDNVPHVIRLKVPAGETITFTDLIRGEVSFHSDLVDDKVLIKSDGMPTYHLAHLVDDIEMQITHVIRGEEWLPSAPAHILLYRFLKKEESMPAYAHLPLLLKPEGNGKLSKRDGDRLGFPVFPIQWKDPVTGEISSGYREQGYYPEAFINMLALLGWNPGTEQEIFSMEELIQLFSFEHVHKNGARFDPEKAKWFNAQWLHRKPSNELAAALKTQIEKKGWMKSAFDESFFLKAVELLKTRVHFEHEMAETGKYLFCQPSSYDEKVISKKWKETLRPFFEELSENIFPAMESFTASAAMQAFHSLSEKHGLKTGEVMPLLRVFLTGTASGVDLFPMIELLGKEEVTGRLQNALLHLAKK
jgi:glutamyl-tRNA synthetase